MSGNMSPEESERGQVSSVRFVSIMVDDLGSSLVSRSVPELEEDDGDTETERGVSRTDIEASFKADSWRS